MNPNPHAAVSLDAAAARGPLDRVLPGDTLRRRESLLAAAARMSHLLLEAPNAMQVMPEVLRLLGEASGVDRTALALAEIGPNGERWLVIKHEWTAEGVEGQGCEPGRMAWSERKSDCFCTELQSGRSVFVCRERSEDAGQLSIASDRAKSSMIVPILVGNEYAGAIGFDDCRQSRQFDPAIVSALEIAAGLIGAALHRERLVDAIVAERTRIGQEIHDGLAQAFTGILMQLGAAEEFMGCAKESPLPVILNRIRDLARDGLTEARRSVLALRPDQSRPGGLELALRQLAERSTVQGRVSCLFEGGTLRSVLPPEYQHELLRIAQEAVSNAMRHARPKTVRIRLVEEDGHWVLTVTDDGCGMRQLPEQCAKQGFGLENMRERARAIGGQWQIQSRPNAGTQVTVRLPTVTKR